MLTIAVGVLVVAAISVFQAGRQSEARSWAEPSSEAAGDEPLSFGSEPHPPLGDDHSVDTTRGLS
ncbi:unnamed protein product [marine sediment metagenome]|uniref:Uncharacterized protein n=1 Tax=marine sediment metagenome TaxID=412755 RepID=X0W9U4_9ZZZZ